MRFGLRAIRVTTITATNGPEGFPLAKSRILGATWLIGAIALGAVLAEGYAGPARAQGKLDATYTVTLSGVPIGNGSWTIDVQDDQFTAAANGATTGLLRVFASGQGSSVTRGTVSAGQLVPSTYAESRPRAADGRAPQECPRPDDGLADPRAGYRRHLRAAGL
jgi:hypothetical protein